MALLVNIHNLEKEPIQLQGEIPAEQLDLDGVDELIRVTKPLEYDLEIELLDKSVLARGSISLILDCECVRCLNPFPFRLEIDDWAGHLALEGEEKVDVSNDCVDLTPQIREDILLEFPQHPLCKPECSGLPKKAAAKKKTTDAVGPAKEASLTWAELNKLKL